MALPPLPAGYRWKIHLTRIKPVQIKAKVKKGIRTVGYGYSFPSARGGVAAAMERAVTEALDDFLEDPRCEFNALMRRGE
ncbi:hypothetical protein [Mycolicibacterium houstonense]|uniref:hypothetical protein n=1 Tax=Mycolicibacterium houstonense TaxID=146021 RepID=UPI00082B990A|nr:hypothetical protein [Mycolicibacterium houstonense]